MEERRNTRDGGQRKGRLNDSLPSSNFVKLETPYEVLLQRERDRERWGGGWWTDIQTGRQTDKSNERRRRRRKEDIYYILRH